MKNKCLLCLTGKARRTCPLKNGMIICSKCCAEIRETGCGECPHYAESKRYALQREDCLPNRHFIIEIDPEVEKEVDHALEKASQGKLKKAFKTMKRLADEHPRDHTVCYGMGTLCALNGNDAEAIPWFEKSVSIFPYMAEAHYNLGISYQRTYNLGRMIKSLRKALQYGDSQGESYQRARIQLENMKQSIAENEGVDLDSYVASSENFEAAFRHMENHQWDTALKRFKKAASHNKNNAPIYGNMGICLAQLGRKAEALVALDRALEIYPEYRVATSNRKIVRNMKEGVPLENADYQTIFYSVKELEKKR